MTRDFFQQVVLESIKGKKKNMYKESIFFHGAKKHNIVRKNYTHTSPLLLWVLIKTQKQLLQKRYAKSTLTQSIKPWT